MAGLHRFPELPFLPEALLNSFRPTVTLFPSLAPLMFRPLVLHIRERRVEERTAEPVRANDRVARANGVGEGLAFAWVGETPGETAARPATEFRSWAGIGARFEEGG